MPRSTLPVAASVRFQSLTPVWTGGPNQACENRLFETGFLGSVRWWFEACARAWGIRSNEPWQAQYDSDHREDLDAVSRVFGCTGWKRRFRVVVSHAEPVQIPREIARPPRGNKPVTWFYGKRQGREELVRAWGDFDLKIIQAAPWTNYDGTSLSLLLDLLRFVSQYGFVCAKPQLGLGIVRLENGNDEGFPALQAWLQRFGNPSEAHEENLPSLRHLYFAEVPAPQSQSGESDGAYWSKTTFALKEAFRNRYRGTDKNDDFRFRGFRHEIAGTTAGSAVRSKLFISHPYRRNGDWVQRVVIWLPPWLVEAYRSVPRNSGNLLEDVKQFLTREGSASKVTSLYSLMGAAVE